MTDICSEENLVYYYYPLLLITFPDHFILSILLQDRISKLIKCFSSNFLSAQVSKPYKAPNQFVPEFSA